MRTKVIGGEDLVRTANTIIRETGDMLAVMVIGGDRASVCDEAVVCVDDPFAGVATLSPEGELEDGQPTIVGVYVQPERCGKGIGSCLLKAAVDRMLERGFDRIRVDVLTRGGKRIIEKLPAELRSYLDVHEQLTSF